MVDLSSSQNVNVYQRVLHVIVMIYPDDLHTRLGTFLVKLLHGYLDIWHIDVSWGVSILMTPREVGFLIVSSSTCFPLNCPNLFRLPNDSSLSIICIYMHPSISSLEILVIPCDFSSTDVWKKVHVFWVKLPENLENQNGSVWECWENHGKAWKNA